MFDEAHGIVEDQRFRPDYISAVRRLSELPGTPVIFTSGTMSAQFTHQFWKVLDLMYRPDQAAIVVRTRTQQPKVFYQFMVLNTGYPPSMKSPARTSWYALWRAQTIQVICEAVNRLRRQERGLIYFVSKNECMDWAFHLGCPHVTADIPPDLRRNHFADWHAGKHPILCLNKAGYYGFDYDSVAFAIFVGACMSVNDFYQSSGRVGRGDNIGMSLTLLPAAQQKPDSEALCFVVYLSMSRTVFHLGCCHRAFPSMHLDGPKMRVTCMVLRDLDPSTVLCAVCYTKQLGKLDGYDFDDPWGKPFSAYDSLSTHASLMSLSRIQT